MVLSETSTRAAVAAGSGPEVEVRDVEVWVLPATLAPETVERAERALSPHERDHARTLTPGLTRESWVARCHAVRGVLGAHLGIGEEEVALLHDAAGRLRVAAANGTYVGVSATTSRIVVALSDAQVGVDVEPLVHGREDLIRRWTARGAMSKAVRLDPGTELDLYVEWHAGQPVVRHNALDAPTAWSITSLVVHEDTIVSVAVRAAEARWHLSSIL